MLKDIIYYSSYLFILIVLVRLGLNRKYHPSDVLFLVGVSLIPIGKLFYMPLTGLVSVTAAFIFTTIIGSVSLLLNFIKGIEKFVLVPFIFVIPVLLSIVFLYAPSQSMFVSAASNASSAGSPLLRVISVFFTCIYCAYVIAFVSTNKNSRKDIATYYVLATLFATFIGAFITYGLFVGQLTRDDVMLVSVEDVHMAGRIYRFNPGSSVNEFGEIIGYAILMLRWTGWQTIWKVLVAVILLAAEFLSLTRGAWLGLIVGYFVYALFSDKKQRTRIFLSGGLLVAILLAVVASSDVLRYLLISRTTLGPTPGGDDRLNTAAAVFSAMTGSPIRMLFGYGWSADIFSPNYGFAKIGYIHSVPLMIFFDTGMVGLVICAVTFYVLGKFVYTHVRQDLDILAGFVAFMFTVASFEHIFYHVQTWLIFGLILGIALRSAKPASVAALAGGQVHQQPSQ